MVEAFGGRPEYTVDEVACVEKLDETGIRLVLRIGGVPVFQLEHPGRRVLTALTTSP